MSTLMRTETKMTRRKTVLGPGYREQYLALFREALSCAARGELDEVAIPSYTHPNPLIRWLFWRRIEMALRMISGASGKAVLDFGCGGGVTFSYLASKGHAITGVDPLAVPLARKSCDFMELESNLTESIETIPEQSQDIILALDVLEHIDDLDGTLASLARVARRPCLLVISGPTENLLYRAGRRLAGFSGHYHVSNIYDIETAVHRRGWLLDRSVSLYNPIPLFRVTRWWMG
ncbi:MAG: class I SAM-dependent methyltransferase [Acidobacteria bacterium]|uniref:Class I SAM-dependent methyltransferase n=1 Tax=Candidatus Polarisedimenticola svalbardensis TaxID=2886004 RepID=A0A8J7CL33_9BACT|nr:class I SAM-dependent methyltransferase [Candidatus Polarisedimenticola svalbardensis]